MSELGGLIGRKPLVDGPVSDPKRVKLPEQNNSNNILELDPELFAPIASQLGKDNDLVRNLPTDAECRVNELDAIKETISRLVTLAQEYVASLEAAKTEQTAEHAARQAEIAELKRRLQQGDAELQNVCEENRRISERIINSDKKLVQLETEIDSARQKAILSDRERASLQTMLDESTSEQSRVSRRLVEADNALTTSNARLRQLDSALSDARQERARQSQATDEMQRTQRMRIDALHARAATTEKLLDEARQALAARAEEVRGYERRLSEATLVRNMIEGKLGQIESGLAERDAQIRDLEQTRGTLVERNDALTKAVTARENAYNRSQEKIGSLEERISQLECELRGSRESAELQIEKLNTELHRKRVERTMAEGALESARNDTARAMRELASLQDRAAPAEKPNPVPPVLAEKPSHLPPAPNLRSVA